MRSKNAWLNFVRSNLGNPSVAVPGPVLCHGKPVEESVIHVPPAAQLQAIGRSLCQRIVALCPCEAKRFTKAVKSITVKAPLFPISCALFQVCDPANITPLPDLSTNQCEFGEQRG